MTKEPDEDLIEATIRRVAEAKAARAGGGQSHETDTSAAPASAPPPPPPPAADAAPNADEDRIAETIRRVAEAKAARAVGERVPAADAVRAAAPRPIGNPVPAPARESAPNDAPVTASALSPAPPPAVDAAPNADEDRIAETIRRVAEAKATRVIEPSAPEAESDFVQARAPRPIVSTAPPQTGEPVPVAPPETSAEGWERAIAELRRALEETRGKLRALSERFESTLVQETEFRPASQAAVREPDDDDWDDTPRLPRIPLGQPPRPAIMRDPSPRTATAEHLEPEPETIIDTRPLPKPLPPLHAEPRRGLDLLPRTYRITVEDKRRGVDLVPLHRALLGMDGVRDMSLLSYSNGVAIVAVDTVDELEPQTLEGAIARAMSRPAKVEVHNDTTMVVKLAEE